MKVLYVLNNHDEKTPNKLAMWVIENKGRIVGWEYFLDTNNQKINLYNYDLVILQLPIYMCRDQHEDVIELDYVENSYVPGTYDSSVGSFLSSIYNLKGSQHKLIFFYEDNFDAIKNLPDEDILLDLFFEQFKNIFLPATKLEFLPERSPIFQRVEGKDYKILNAINAKSNQGCGQTVGFEVADKMECLEFASVTKKAPFMSVFFTKVADKHSIFVCPEFVLSEFTPEFMAEVSDLLTTGKIEFQPKYTIRLVEDDNGYTFYVNEDCKFLTKKNTLQSKTLRRAILNGGLVSRDEYDSKIKDGTSRKFETTIKELNTAFENMFNDPNFLLLENKPKNSGNYVLNAKIIN